MKRPLVIVSDLERSLDFYVDVVGLEVYKIDPYYNRDPQSLGYQMFDVPVGARKRDEWAEARRIYEAIRSGKL